MLPRALQLLQASLGHRLMERLRDRLAAGGVILADGAMGTMLHRLGFEGAPCLELLNLARPDAVRLVLRAYLDAGAELLQTNTFGASPIRLARCGLEAETERINRAAAVLARSVAGRRAWVTGSCGPCGRHLIPIGDLEPAEFIDSCRRQLAALSAGGVDAFSIETMTDVEEALLAIQVAREVAPDGVVMASATLAESPDGFHTPFGTPLDEVAARLADAGADVIGINCSEGMEAMIRAARRLRPLTAGPLLVRPNAGKPEVQGGVTVWNDTPELFADGLQQLLEIGVNIVGGCCGTTPEHIRQARRVVDEWRTSARRSRSGGSPPA